MSLPKFDTDLPAVTEWFPPAETPAREGVYERGSTAARFACWNGRAWNADARTPADAARQTAPSPDQSRPWRGLAVPAGAPCGTCRGHTVLDRGVDAESGVDRIDECPDC